MPFKKDNSYSYVGNRLQDGKNEYNKVIWEATNIVQVRDDDCSFDSGGKEKIKVEIQNICGK